MMQTMSYNLQQGKFAVEENSLYKFQQAKQVVEEVEEENLQAFSGDYNHNCKSFVKNNRSNSSSRATRSVDLDTLFLKYGSDPHQGTQTGSESLRFEDLDTLYPNSDGSLLPWIMGDPVDPGLGFKNLLQSSSGHPLNNVGAFEGQFPSVAFGANCQQFDPFVGPDPIVDPFQGRQLGSNYIVKDELFKASELIQMGNFTLAHEILARLNHLVTHPTNNSPQIRAGLLVKEALETLLQLSNPAVTVPLRKTLSPYDVVHKMSAYKAFSEVSPITQFVNFTCTQAILEAVSDSSVIHVVDFDIGCGAQWASLIQELPLRKMGATSLKITAFAPSSTHPFELALVRDNLVQFANDSGVAFDLHVVSLESFDLSSCTFPNFRISENEECVAVSIPVWSSSLRPSILPSILRFVNQCSPKIVVSWDLGLDRWDVPFPQHVVYSLESATNFMESVDSLNAASNVIHKIEKFLLQPRILNTILGRLHSPVKTPHWRNVFVSAGFTPLQFSNFTETQADYVVRRSPGNGFRVEKRQASLLLSWQRRDLVEVSMWRC